jgi:hypothetical protein
MPGAVAHRAFVWMEVHMEILYGLIVAVGLLVLVLLLLPICARRWHLCACQECQARIMKVTDKRSTTPAAQGANWIPAHEPPQRPAPATGESVNAKWKDNAGMWIGVFVVLVGAQWIVWLVLNVIGWSEPGIRR